ncbi:hypothetical protein ACERJO_17415 [Halalkalibacter sp. AB-rgal2]|uniref:hypothetical protein n=1 Tax=Halalkalibacter sp. AB-rgal2 TaxID=3242695 RepID=UPI00359E8DEE
MSNLTKVTRLGGYATLGMTLCYLSMFIIFFVLISVPAGLDTLGMIEFLQEGQLLFAISYTIALVI